MTKLFNYAQLKEDITGRWSLEAKGYLYLAPFQAFFSVLIIPNLNNFKVVGLAVLANIISISICATVFLIFSFTAFRNRKTKNVSLWWVLIAGIVLGATKGIATGYFVWLFGLEPELARSILSRIIQTVALGIWWVPTMALVFAYRERFRLQRDALITERVYLANANQQTKFGKAHKLIDSNKALRSFVESVKRQLAEGAQIAGEDYKYMAEVVRQIIQDDLRPLSHKIWEQENERLADFSLRDLSNLAITKYIFKPWLALPIYMLTVAPVIASRQGVNGAIIETFIEIVVICAIFPLAPWLVPKRIGLAWIYFIFLGVLNTVISSFLINQIFRYEINSEYIFTILINLSWLLMLMYLTGLLRSALANQSKIEEELVELVGRDKAIEQWEFHRKRLVNRELAQYLHGHVQNRLLASALRMEQAELASDPYIIANELNRVEELLDTATNGFKRTGTLSFVDEINSVRMQWEGLVKLDIEISPDVELLTMDAGLVNDASQAVNEIISNSVRHGFASKIRISIFMGGSNKLVITSLDDGLGPRNGIPGLGSFLFDSLCGGNWSLSAAIGGGSLGRYEVSVA